MMPGITFTPGVNNWAELVASIGDVFVEEISNSIIVEEML
jgi:hypothetical protein